MSDWFWYFLIYSFLGFCLEKLFAWAIRSPHQVRKCFLLLPLCPVYGLAMTALLALTPGGVSFLPLAALGGLVCTGTEYLIHLFYDKVLGVRFWDYRDMPGQIHGRICPQFAAAWGLLSALAVRWVQPWAAALAAVVDPAVTYAVWLLLAADGFVTAVLRQYRDIDLLSIPALLAQMRASSQSSTSR